ncbi:MAG: hypothetical protein JSS49_24300 [Planctomycetes bacterium]|nr:hypothetical protein [Planctomycetota bacterium]
MNYDSWKLASDLEGRSEILADRCSDIESCVDGKLKLAITQTNRVSDSQWDAEPSLAEADDDGQITLELTLRLKHVPVCGTPGDLQELAQAFLRMGESLAHLARSNQTSQGLKLASSVQQRDVIPKSDLG